MAAAASLLVGAAKGQVNDECMGATLLTNGTATSFDSTGASASAPVFSCGLVVGSDVWFGYFTTSPNASVVVETCGTSFDTVLEVFEGTSCSNLTLLDCNDDTCGDGSRVTLTVPTAGTLLVVRVGGTFANSGPGVITLTETQSPCSSTIDDGFEDNDTCATATPLAAGVYPGLVATLTDPDHYSVVVPSGGRIEVLLFDNLNTDLDVTRSDASCSPVVTLDQDGFFYDNVSGAPEVVNYEVFVDPLNAGPGCITYMMDVRVSTPPDCSTPDALESGVDCASALPIGDGTYPDLNAADTDNDYYAVGIDPGATISVDLTFDQLAGGNLDLFLWDPTIACDTNVAGTSSSNGALAAGTSPVSNEQLTYTNTSGAFLSLVLEVDMAQGACNEYDMTISGSTIPDGSIGMTYCATNVNSTGSAGVMQAFGSLVVINNDVMLGASQLPTLSFGFFITSATQGFVMNPGGSDGNLCLSGNIGRYVGPGQIQNTGLDGSFSLQADLTSVPQPSGAVAAQAGQTWNFQAWHRDTGASGPSSNFTNGIALTFQ